MINEAARDKERTAAETTEGNAMKIPNLFEMSLWITGMVLSLSVLFQEAFSRSPCRLIAVFSLVSILITTAFILSFILDHRFGLHQGFTFYNDKFVKPKQKRFLHMNRRASEVSFLAQEWLTQMEESIKTHPFFLWRHYYDPHADHDAPEPYGTAYSSKHDGKTAYTDAWIVFFLNRLKMMGLMANTLLVITTDHGENLGQYGEGTHGLFIYRPTTHVPLIFRCPSKLPQGIKIPERVSSAGVDADQTRRHGNGKCDPVPAEER